MMRSGALKVAAFSPSAAFSASMIEKPWSSNPARRNRLIFGSSSITRTTLAGLFMVEAVKFGDAQRGAGQGDGSGGSLSLTPARDVDGSTVCFDEGGCNPEAKSGPRDGGLMARASERF